MVKNLVDRFERCGGRGHRLHIHTVADHRSIPPAQGHLHAHARHHTIGQGIGYAIGQRSPGWLGKHDLSGPALALRIQFPGRHMGVKQTGLMRHRNQLQRKKLFSNLGVRSTAQPSPGDAIPTAPLPTTYDRSIRPHHTGHCEMEEPPSGQPVGVYGGTFDPVHWGHLLAAEHACEALGLARVVFLPARHSPFKPDRPPLSAQHRLAMLRLSLYGNDRFELDTRELDREGPSFTIDSLQDLSRAHPDWDMHLLLGADAIEGFDRWKEPEQIVRLARLCVFARGGHPPPDLRQLAPLTGSLPGGRQPRVVAIPQIEISSSDIRQRVRTGRSIRYLVHPAVQAYIAQHRLYADQ
ncbi:MAG: nicotinate (nicotinamide) nucleotide adenylyltransferase [Planctomycetota bacterium]|nr:MAG: nicotinate (nicotinamide) nucleotide adenylyltransferase [Planctomycetota bacterium]